MIRTLIKIAFTLTLLATLAACGGGGGGATGVDTTPIALKLITTGTPSANLAGIGITITLPDGVIPALNGDGSVADGVITVSGVAAAGTVLVPIYTPATATSQGKLHFALSSNIADGFGAGEFATVTLRAVAGKNPVLAAFTLSDFTPIDIAGNVATGLTAEFLPKVQ